MAVVETTEVTTHNYQGVDTEFAREEGEGDLSLDYWREGHWRFFGRTLAQIGKTPTLDMPLVCEKFRVVYKQPAP
ncbi:ASCH domain-containing protein [Meiothermus sp.]|uniref:ASCH domain-containing protein n=1 Tax=Meiothermus sp. TaxID=1955249 RepID=UPI00307D5A5C